MTILVNIYRPGEDQVRASIISDRGIILKAAERYQVDTGVIAAILYVTARHEIGPFRLALEEAAMTPFLFDSRSNARIFKAMNISIGIAQIKPVTALTGLVVCTEAGKPWDLFSKELRDVPALGVEWKWKTADLPCCELPVPQESLKDLVRSPKFVVVEALSTDEGSIEFAAMLLALYQTQWRLADPSWDISHRPDILATLYQIGFERSHPHASPHSNAFGDRVLTAYQQPWLRAAFPP